MNSDPEIYKATINAVYLDSLFTMSFIFGIIILILKEHLNSSYLINQDVRSCGVFHELDNENFHCPTDK